MTNLASRRASQFGGKNIYRFFCLPTVVNASPLKIAEQALQKQDKKWTKYAIRLQLMFRLFKIQVWSTQRSGPPWISFYSNFAIAFSIRRTICDSFWRPNATSNYSRTGNVFEPSFTHLFSFTVPCTLCAEDGPCRTTPTNSDGENAFLPEKTNGIDRIISSPCNVVPNWNFLRNETVMSVFAKQTTDRKDSIRNSRWPSVIVKLRMRFALLKAPCGTN